MTQLQSPATPCCKTAVFFVQSLSQFANVVSITCVVYACVISSLHGSFLLVTQLASMATFMLLLPAHLLASRLAIDNGAHELCDLQIWRSPMLLRKSKGLHMLLQLPLWKQTRAL